MLSIRLHEVTDPHFAWLLGECDTPDGLIEAPGGVDERAVISMLRDLTASLHQVGCQSHWLIVVEREVVGLCGFKRPPTSTGEAEIGYGIARSRRGMGYASQAIALMVNRARQEGVVKLVAETATSNHASQVVLEKNGFSRIGMRHDIEDGELILWSTSLSA